MTDLEKIEARLANTEKALLALAEISMNIQPGYIQEAINKVMSEYFEANSTMGLQGSKGFIKHD